ncbi:hypothetical protein FHX42_005186 [Saccharopolyspora lacisalsi]|uniref:Uncharacterized protein n=1 Tax=Halosaccharopolyspora lacisalsi TaxID=1000566 RepID=A0A839E4K1_9PSEU|nr:hypothetical protein [Halosaccharopolyspora lacisalsi]
MPTVEFFGMDNDKQEKLERYLLEELSQDDFRDDCVFVRAARSQVVDRQGRSHPFVRVSTRSADRAERFRRILQGNCDLEVVRIDFHPRSSTIGG